MKYEKENQNKIGIIFNLDVHTGKGTHWTAMYVNIPKKQIYYYDSVGNNPPNEIVVLLEEMSEELYGKNNKDQYEIFRESRQQGSSECGVYAVHFLIAMVTEAFTFEEYSNLKLPDQLMEQYREIFWV